MPQEKNPRIENARRLYEAMQNAGFTPQTFQDLGEKGQLGCSFRELMPDTIRALLKVTDAFTPATPPGRRKPNAKQKAPSVPSRDRQNASASGTCEEGSETRAQDGGESPAA